MTPSEHTEQTESRSIVDSTRFRALTRASGMAIGVDLFLILLKYLLAKLTGSPVLLADALHSGGDLTVSLLVFLSILINHNFKTHRWLKNAERLAALLISLLLILWSFKFVQGTLYREAREFWVLRGIPLVVAIAGISLALTIAFAMAQFKRRIGDRYDSIAFLAEGKHSYADFLTSFGVWLTLVAGYFGIHIERLMTVLVGIAVLHIGIRLFMEAISPLRKLFSFVSKLLPSRLRSFFRQWRARLISLKPLPFFFREQWILSHKKQLLMGNIGCILLLYIGTWSVYRVPRTNRDRTALRKGRGKNSARMASPCAKTFWRCCTGVYWCDSPRRKRVSYKMVLHRGRAGRLFVGIYAHRRALSESTRMKRSP